MGSIVCFGDSNTWGLNPGIGRYDKDTRWTGILRNRYDGRYMIVEEGLNGRTANERDEDEPYLNGRDYAPACLLSHRPIDILIVMLGTNDVKVRYKKTADMIADSVYSLVSYMEDVLRMHQPENFSIIVVSPKAIDERAVNDGTFDYDSVKKSGSLGMLLEKKVKDKNWIYIDANTEEIKLSYDGVHLSKEGHAGLADIIEKNINHI